LSKLHAGLTSWALHRGCERIDSKSQIQKGCKPHLDKDLRILNFGFATDSLGKTLDNLRVESGRRVQVIHSFAPSLLSNYAASAIFLGYLGDRADTMATRLGSGGAGSVDSYRDLSGISGFRGCEIDSTRVQGPRRSCLRQRWMGRRRCRARDGDGDGQSGSAQRLRKNQMENGYKPCLHGALRSLNLERVIVGPILSHPLRRPGRWISVPGRGADGSSAWLADGKDGRRSWAGGSSSRLRGQRPYRG
jgi:hypothetical protein